MIFYFYFFYQRIIKTYKNPTQNLITRNVIKLGDKLDKIAATILHPKLMSIILRLPKVSLKYPHINAGTITPKNVTLANKPLSFVDILRSHCADAIINVIPIN